MKINGQKVFFWEGEQITQHFKNWTNPHSQTEVDVWSCRSLEVSKDCSTVRLNRKCGMREAGLACIYSEILLLKYFSRK